MKTANKVIVSYVTVHAKIIFLYSSVDDVIQAVTLAVKTDKIFGLTVSRHNMVERGLVQSSPVNLLKITFLGEAGVDTGALRKEFLTST